MSHFWKHKKFFKVSPWYIYTFSFMNCTHNTFSIAPVCTRENQCFYHNDTLSFPQIKPRLELNTSHNILYYHIPNPSMSCLHIVIIYINSIHSGNCIVLLLSFFKPYKYAFSSFSIISNLFIKNNSRIFLFCVVSFNMQYK